jgi:hypothetical protein
MCSSLRELAVPCEHLQTLAADKPSLVMQENRITHTIESNEEKDNFGNANFY